VTDTQSIVRIGTMDDWASMLELLDLMYEENSIVSKSQEKIEQVLRRGLNRDGAIVGVIGAHDHIEASIGLFAHQYWYSDDYHIEDHWCFVHPKFRQPGKGGGNRPSYARQLCKFAKKCALDLDIPLLIGVLSSHRTEAKVNLYRRNFAEAGAGFVFNVKHGSFVEAPHNHG
jgi:hypothetical protein